MMQEPKSLNIALDDSSAVTDLSMFVFSYAVRYDSLGRPRPDALLEVPTVDNGDVSKDGLTLTYRLRRNITFHDGVPLTCKDLVFSWRYVMDPKTDVAATDGYSSIASIRCTDRYTAVLRMKSVYAPFLETIFAPNGTVPILPEHLLAKYMDGRGGQNTAPFNNMPIGSGPFKVLEWRHGTVVRLQAYDGYFMGRPKLNEVEFFSEPDENTTLIQLQTHAIDLLDRGSPLNWPRYRALADQPSSGLNAIQVSSYLYDHIDFNLENPLLADRRVRRALAYATDRHAIIDKIFQGAVYPSDSPEHPKLSWAYTTDTVHYQFDPRKARALFDADGWKVGPDGVRSKNGRRLELTLSAAAESTIGKEVELFVQAQWRTVGVQVDIKNYAAAQMYANGPSAILAGGHFDVAYYTWNGAADPDLNAAYSAKNFGPSGQNFMRWSNEKATAALSDGLRTVDQARRRSDYVVFQQELASDVPTIVISFRKEAYAYNSDLRGYDPSPVLSSFWDPWEYAI